MNLDNLANIIFGIGGLTFIGVETYGFIRNKKMEEERKEENYNNEMIKLLEEYE